MRCPFKIGEKIVCIKTQDFVSSWSRDTKEITVLSKIGNVYEVCVAESKLYDNICIMGDHGYKYVPTWTDFVTFKEYRKLKLDKINDSSI